MTICRFSTVEFACSILARRDVQCWIGSEEAEWLEGEAGHLHRHHRKILNTHNVGHAKGVPDDRVPVYEALLLAEWQNKESAGYMLQDGPSKGHPLGASR